MNDDGRITPQDALLIANALQQPGWLSADGGGLDVDADGRVTSRDFAAVAGHLNQLASGVLALPREAEAEGPWEP